MSLTAAQVELIKQGMTLAGTAMQEISAAKKASAAQDQAIKKEDKMANIASIINLIAAVMPGTISIVRELAELYKMLTDEGVQPPSIEEFEALTELLRQLPDLKDLPIPGEV